MTVTVRTLLENALYMSVADREFSPVEPDGSQINVALDRFIQLLDTYRDQVPYANEKTITSESALENIDASQITYINYILGSNVAYPMTDVTQIELSRLSLITDLRSIPTYYWLDEANNAIRVYPLPQTTSDTFIIGFRPTLVASNLDEEIPKGITSFMQLFLEYELAKGLSDIYTLPWSTEKETSRARYYLKLLENSQNAISSPDKPNLRGQGFPIPYLAYLSGNTPGG